MKRLFTISLLSLFVMLLSAQEKKELMYISLSTGEVMTFDVTEVKSIHFEFSTVEEEVPAFPKDDGSKKLDIYNPQKTACNLLKSAGVGCTDTMGRIVITSEEYSEIEQFADGLVKGCTTEKEIHDACFNWIYKNVKHGSTYDNGSFVSNDPYQAFDPSLRSYRGRDPFGRSQPKGIRRSRPLRYLRYHLPRLWQVRRFHFRKYRLR